MLLISAEVWPKGSNKNIDHPALYTKLQTPEKKLQLGPLLQLVLPLNELKLNFNCTFHLC